MGQRNSSEVVMKNTAKAVIVPLKDGFSSLNGVYKALIKADVDPVTGKCINYDYIRQQIVQAHQHLQSSEQMTSSGLKRLDKNLEKLIRDEGNLERKVNDTQQTLENLTKKQESNHTLLSESQGALELSRTNLDSAKQTLADQESRRQTAQIVTGVGAGLLLIPIVGWIAGSAMVIGGAVEWDQAERAVKVAEEEVEKSESEVNKYEYKVSKYESKISQTRREIRKKDEKLKQTRERIQKVKKQSEAVADFQNKLRSAVQLLGVLSGRAGVAEHQTRRFILQEPVMKVMEDVMKSTKDIKGNELLCNKDMLRLIDQMKENNRRLAAICASENSAGIGY